MNFIRAHFITLSWLVSDRIHNITYRSTLHKYHFVVSGDWFFPDTPSSHHLVLVLVFGRTWANSHLFAPTELGHLSNTPQGNLSWHWAQMLLCYSLYNSIQFPLGTFGLLARVTINDDIGERVYHISNFPHLLISQVFRVTGHYSLHYCGTIRSGVSSNNLS